MKTTTKTRTTTLKEYYAYFRNCEGTPLGTRMVKFHSRHEAINALKLHVLKADGILDGIYEEVVGAAIRSFRKVA